MKDRQIDDFLTTTEHEQSQHSVHKCPVCNGFGTLSYGKKICHACNGSGIIIINEGTGEPINSINR